MTLSAQDIINSLTLNDVKEFLESLEVEQIMVNEEKQYIVCPTICHNPIDEAESMKLYWYHNNKIFRCYTECNEAMSIFELYKKYMALNFYPITFEEAEIYVKSFLKHIVLKSHTYSRFDSNKEKYKYDNLIPQLDTYNNHVLDCFSHYYHPTWLKDGIKPDVMDKFNIKFSYGENKIIIPHYDINGKLIGIRGRALEKDEIENYGKYRPVQIGDVLYTYPLQFNLYGLYQHKNGINARKSVIIAEAEKSTLLDHGYYDDLSNTVACCGSNINKYHISLLLHYTDINEIIIAFDKEYNDWRSDEAKKYRKKIEHICNKYKHLVNFSYIWDYDNLLNEKDAPFDKGKEIFEYLYRNRVKVR